MPVEISGSKHFTPNYQPPLNTDSVAWVIEFFATLASAGWIAVDFSDGSSVTTSITPATLADMDNTNAWQRWRAPSGTFELWVQRGTTSIQWRAAYDVDGFNNDGGAVTTPTETSHLIRLIGNSTAFDTSYSGNTNQADTRRYHICVDSVAGQSGLYYFHIVQTTVGTGAVTRRAVFSPMESGTFSPLDLSPYASIEHAANGTANDTSDWASVYRKGLSGESIQDSLDASRWATFAGGGFASPYGGEHNFIRAQLEVATGGDAHFKGALLDVFLPASATSALGNLDTLNLSTPWGSVAEGDPGALFRFDDLLLPWPHDVTLVV